MSTHPHPSNVTRFGLRLQALAVLGVAATLVACPADDTSQGDVTDTTDTQRQEVTPSLGELGDPCRENVDCASSLCAAVAATGRVCTQTCTDTCPAGYQCVTAEGASVCADARVANCQPCNVDGDCNRAGLTGNKCLGYGDTGSFCASSCTGDGDCPSGYTCDAGSCRFGGETCQCNAIGVAVGAETACAISNEHGSCEGVRGCGAGGLSRCMAATPAAEICDGRDNDCDGETDEALPEETCDLTNEYGTCKGTIECAAGRPLCVGRAPAADVCNGIDDDCDGETDEGARDLDDDGIVDCLDDDIDGDGSLNADDCAPLEKSIFPGQVERCNGFDDNCNRQVDENTQAECGCYVCGGSSGCLTACDDDEDVAPGFVCDVNDFDGDNNRRECQPSVCGNGVVEANEVCDDVQNDGRYGGCLRCDELGPYCGDGIIQPAFELCDDGTLNGEPTHCNATCSGTTPPFCGNGVIEPGEVCDLGPENSNLPDSGCRPDCTPRRCGDGVKDSTEACDAGAANGTSTCGCNAACGFPAAQVVCRASAGVCDAVETCNGAGACAADAKRVGFVCRDPVGACDAPDTCTADSNDCPPDARRPQGTVCRVASGACDVAETCDGTATACPADVFATSATVCRAAATVCDAAETCTGLSRTCPADRPATAGLACRSGNGVCDPGETCNGVSFECPANTFTERGVNCDQDPTCVGGPCACDGLGACFDACGNGELDEGELCDDGELNGRRDGCAMNCQAFCGGEPSWAFSVGGFRNDYVQGVATDLEGTGFAVGYFSGDFEWGGSAEFGDFTLGSRGGTDGFVFAHDADGTITWASCLGGYGEDDARSAGQDADGVYVVGSFVDEATFACCDVELPAAPTLPGQDGCAVVGSFSEDPTKDLYIARWNRDGQLEWVVDGGADFFDDTANDVAVDPMGWAFVVGGLGGPGFQNDNSTMFGDLEFGPVMGTRDAFVAGFNRFGAGSLALTIGGAGPEEALSVALDGGDGIYVLVRASETFNVGEALVSPSFSEDLVVFAFDRSGEYRWHRVMSDVLGLEGGPFPGGTLAYGCNLATGGDGSCGVYAFVNTNAGAYLTKFSLAGVPAFTADMTVQGAILASGVAVERNGNVTVSGAFFGTLTVGEHTLEDPFNGGSEAPQADAFVARANPAGDWLWAKDYGGSGVLAGFAMDLDDKGSVYLGGVLVGTVELGNDTLTSLGSEGNFGNTDGFLAKLVVPDGICYACGDGTVDPGETCDEADMSSCLGSCNASCDGPGNTCGDGLAQCGEDHDFGGGTPDPNMCTFVAGNAWCFEVAAVNPQTNNNFTLDPVRPGEPARYGTGVLRENWNNPSRDNPGPFDGLQGNPNQLSVCPTLEVGQIINHKALSAKQWAGDVVTATGTSEGNRLYCDGNPQTAPSAVAPTNFAAGLNTLGAAIECGDYFEFVSSTGLAVAFEFDNRAGVQGPTNYALYVSLSGTDGTWSYAGRATTFQAGDFGSTFIPPITSFDLSTFVAVEGPIALRPEVHFRLYGWGASSVGDPWTLDNVRVGEPLKNEPYRTTFCFEETENAYFSTTPTIERANHPATFVVGSGLTAFTNINGPTEVLAGCPLTSSTHRAPSATGWSTAATLDTANNKSWGFNFNAPAGNYTFSFYLRRSNTGPSKFAVVSDQLGNIAVDRDSPAGTVWARFSFPIQHEGGPLTLKVFGYGASSVDGTGQIDSVDLVASP